MRPNVLLVTDSRGGLPRAGDHCRAVDLRCWSAWTKLVSMDEWEAQDAAVEQARDRPGFDETIFRAGFGGAYAAAFYAGHA